MKSLLAYKKGNLGTLYPAILTLVLVGVLLSIGLYILGSMQTTMTGAANTSIGNTITAMATIASTWLPIIVIVVAASIVIGILVGSFSGKRQ